MCVSTGNRYLDIGIGVAIGAATGGLSAPLTVGAGGVLTPTLTATVGSTITGLGATSITSSIVGGAVLGGLGSAVTGALFAPPKLPQAPQQTAQVQQFNTQQLATTGSGGRQATASLAEAITRSKQRKLTQEDVGDLSIDTSAFASTGLQLA